MKGTASSSCSDRDERRLKAAAVSPCGVSLEASPVSFALGGKLPDVGHVADVDGAVGGRGAELVPAGEVAGCCARGCQAQADKNGDEASRKGV